MKKFGKLREGTVVSAGSKVEMPLGRFCYVDKAINLKIETKIRVNRGEFKKIISLNLEKEDELVGLFYVFSAGFQVSKLLGCDLQHADYIRYTKREDGKVQITANYCK